MRLLTLLATTVLLAGCVHDTEDFNLFLAESGVSLTYYIGSDSGSHQKNHDDPWDTIRDSFSEESTHAGLVKAHDDPWDTIGESFFIKSIHTGKDKGGSFMGKPIAEMLFASIGGKKGGENDPWDRTGDLFPAEKSGGVLLKLVEVRGQVGRFYIVSASDGGSMDGPSVFAVGVPSDWESGLVLRGETYLLETEKLPLLIPRSGFASSGSPGAAFF